MAPLEITVSRLPSKPDGSALDRAFTVAPAGHRQALLHARLQLASDAVGACSWSWSVQGYARIRDGLNATGRKALFILCGWNPWYAPDPSYNYSGGMWLASLWRIGPDDTNWHGILTSINNNAPLAKHVGPGGFNDPCLQLSTDPNNNFRITELQSRAQLSMWAVMASPLIVSGNVRNMSKMNMATYQNAEVIAVNQESFGLQGQRIAGGDLGQGQAMTTP